MEKYKIPLLNTLNPQTSPLGRPYRQISVSRDGRQPERWIGRELRSCWIYTFRYIDEQGGRFEVLQDHNGNTRINK